MVVEPDGSLTVHMREEPHAENRKLVYVALILAMVLAVLASTAFVVAVLEVRSSRQSAEVRDQQAAARDQRAAIERAELGRQLDKIRVEASLALGEQQCRSLAFAKQNSVEADADVVALELLTEVVAQTFRSARGQALQFARLKQLEQRARESVQAESTANAEYRAALGDCETG